MYPYSPRLSDTSILALEWDNSSTCRCSLSVTFPLLFLHSLDSEPRFPFKQHSNAASLRAATVFIPSLWENKENLCMEVLLCSKKACWTLSCWRFTWSEAFWEDAHTRTGIDGMRGDAFLVLGEFFSLHSAVYFGACPCVSSSLSVVVCPPRCPTH